MDLAAALQRLATYRAHKTRASQETFECGLVVLENNGVWKMGNQGWDFLEQLALASIDVGHIEVADRCLQILTDKFPDSPRVDCLRGIRVEATESPQTALAFYSDLLAADETQAAVWKRKISVLRRMGSVELAVKELNQFLEAFYTDIEAWLELADIYSSCCQFTLALQALSHAMLLTPKNPYHALQAAETAYTAGDITLSIKMFFLVIEMIDDAAISKTAPIGILIRAWYGVHLSANRLANDERLSSTSASQTPAPKRLDLIQGIAQERLRSAYDSISANVDARSRALTWLTDTS